MPSIAALLDTLEGLYGAQTPSWPTDPYSFLIWWHSGYPASDASCTKGWESLKSQIGVDPDRLLSTSPAKLTLALKPGGMMPDIRAIRLQEIAERVQKEFGGDLRAALNGLSITQVRSALKKFPSIGNPGVDRILLFAGISPVAAVASNCPHVLVRIRTGQEPANYGKAYSEAQRLIAVEVPPTCDARIRAYLLLKCHGQQLCKRSKPKCTECPVAPSCAFFAGKTGGRSD